MSLFKVVLSFTDLPSPCTIVVACSLMYILKQKNIEIRNMHAVSMKTRKG